MKLKNKRLDFLVCYSMLADKGIIRGGEGVVQAGEGVIRTGQDL